MKRTLAIGLLSLFVPLAACERGEPGEAAIEQAEDDLSVETPDVMPRLAADVARLDVDTLNGVGPYITDGQGRALYLFTPDSAGVSTCYEGCAEAWPPLMAGGADPAAGAGVRSELIGTIEREGAGMQVTYGGHPLYYFHRDSGAGEATGQDVHGFGGEWYLITPSGTELESGGGE